MVMQISDLVAWLTSPDNFGTLVSAAASLVALILGLIFGGIIVSSQAGKLTRTADEHAKASVVAEVLDATSEIAVFASLPAAAQGATDRVVARVDVRLRVLPVQGAGSIADWTGHQLNELKRASAVGVTAAQTTLDGVRDRLVLWIYNPKRAAKLCQRDLERWSFVSGGQASTGRRTPAQAIPADPMQMPPAAGYPAQPAPGFPTQAAPGPAPAPAAAPAGPAPVPAATSSIPAAAAAHAQAAATQPKDPFEDLLGPAGSRR